MQPHANAHSDVIRKPLVIPPAPLAAPASHTRAPSPADLPVPADARQQRNTGEQPTTGEQPLECVEGSRSERLNRAVNIVLAGTALTLLLPLFLLVAIAIRLTSRGPIIYRQTRVGLDRRRQSVPALRDRRRVDIGGRPFSMYKFRSMTVDAEKNGITWAQKGDSRVTPVGRFLRLARIDELPQLFNVLLGDMNIVGPRPERPGIFLHLRQRIPEYPLRQRAKPGITGLAQIEQDYDNCIADVRRKVQYDLTYIRQQSLTQDLRIMLNTLPVMLSRKGSR